MWEERERSSGKKSKENLGPEHEKIYRETINEFITAEEHKEIRGDGSEFHT
jgi:hypothetical protein